MISEALFNENLKILKDRVSHACVSADRKNDEVQILPVTKNWPIEAVYYCKNAGFTNVGENRVQEALEKQSAIDVEKINWELIGRLQGNKAKWIPGRFSRVQTIDSVKLLERLNQFLCKEESKLGIFIQVNTGKDPAKAGITEDQCEKLVDKALSLPNLKLEGFMTIAPYVPDDLNVASDAFTRLRNLRDRISDYYGIPLPELSMGMTGDLKEAIAAGSTMIRVGSALFGQRS